MNWYYLENNESQGPMSLKELLPFISAETLVWREESLQDWVTAKEHPDLIQFFKNEDKQSTEIPLEEKNDENPFIIEDEYNKPLDTDGKIQCPEAHLDYGIQKLKSEDNPKSSRDKKKLILIISAILCITIIVIAVVLLIGGNNKTNKEKEVVKTTPQVTAPVTNTPTDYSISLPSEETLRQELLKIIDTKKTRKEREDIASKIWKVYFYPEAYIDNLMDANDKNPEHWSPGNGKSYLARLITLPSIIDIKILAVERDKETQKISGLKVCEIHNGSKFNQ